MTAFPLVEPSEGEQKGTGRTIDLDLFCSSLNCQFDLRNLAHLEGYTATRSAFDLCENFQNVNGREQIGSRGKKEKQGPWFSIGRVAQTPDVTHPQSSLSNSTSVW